MHHRRRRHATHRRRHVFGKRAVKAIQRIAQKPVETKWFIDPEDLAIIYSPNAYIVGQKSVAWIKNIWQDVPRENGLAGDPHAKVVGQEFMARGVSVDYAFAYPASLAPDPGASSHIMKVRITLISMAPYRDTQPTGLPFSGSDYTLLDVTGRLITPGQPTLEIWEEDDANASATFRRYNTDLVTVIESRQFTLSAGGQSGLFHEGRMWHRFNRKLRMTEDVGDTVDQLKDINYYLVVEIQDPFTFIGGVDQNPNWKLYVSPKLYYKDA